MSARDELRERLADALASAPDGCWDYEDCCYSALDALLPVVEEAIATARTEGASEVAKQMRTLASRWDRLARDGAKTYEEIRRSHARDIRAALAEEFRP